jgi:LAO/AO transport system kinase
VQAIKAGILEIADILVVNKADRPGVENTVRALRAMLDLGHRAERLSHHSRLLGAAPTAPSAKSDDSRAWQTPLIQTIATEGTGMDELLREIAAHHDYLIASGTLERRQRAALEFEITERLREKLLERLLLRTGAQMLTAVIGQVAARELDPGSAVNLLLGSMDVSSNSN